MGTKGYCLFLSNEVITGGKKFPTTTEVLGSTSLEGRDLVVKVRYSIPQTPEEEIEGGYSVVVEDGALKLDEKAFLKTEGVRAGEYLWGLA